MRKEHSDIPTINAKKKNKKREKERDNIEKSYVKY